MLNSIPKREFAHTRGGNKMKIKKEHYEYMKAEISKVPCKVNDHRTWLIANAKFNDLETRLAWDFFHAAKLDKFACDNLYAYCDDTHINTAIKKIIKDITINL
jgi:hypothetical protein